MVGMYAERFPECFGFSGTAFRIFVLPASRRLDSDRFVATDYTPRLYTRTGLDWISANDMCAILLRHFPPIATPVTPTSRGGGPPSRKISE